MNHLEVKPKCLAANLAHAGAELNAFQKLFNQFKDVLSSALSSLKILFSLT